MEDGTARVWALENITKPKVRGRHPPIELVDALFGAAPDGLSLREQIRMHHDLEVFVWGHGAGMVHMLWMRPSGLAIEISPARESESLGAVVIETVTFGAGVGFAALAFLFSKLFQLSPVISVFI